jgi:hypothetical protein
MQYNKFNDSKIYIVRSTASDRVYIGSTWQNLHKRFNDHVRSYKSYKQGNQGWCTIYQIFDENGHDCCYIELLESFVATKQYELIEKEKEWIKRYSKYCTNKFLREKLTPEELSWPKVGPATAGDGNVDEHEIDVFSYREKESHHTCKCEPCRVFAYLLLGRMVL